MEEQLKQAIEVMERRLAEQVAKVASTKKLINELCAEAGEAPRYTDVGTDAGSRRIRSDQFYGQPLSSAVREILEMRKAGGLGAASVNEIYDMLRTGGFHFDAKGDENAKRSLRISLTKNSAIFHRVPNGQYGLLSWYPAAKPPKDNQPDEPAGANGKDDAADEPEKMKEPKA